VLDNLLRVNKENIPGRQIFVESQRELELQNNPNPNTRYLVKDSAEGQFLAHALEKIDATLYKPLYQFFWYQDMPIMYGGGALENASFFKMNFDLQDLNTLQASGNANAFKLVNMQIQKQTTRVNPFGWVIQLGYLDQLKYGQIGFDILSIFDEGVRKQYNAVLDEVAFFGLPGVSDSYGLFNNPAVTVSADGRYWDNYSPVSLFEYINQKIISMIVDMEYDPRLVPNHIATPLEFFANLAKLVSVGGTPVAKTLKQYLEESLAVSFAQYDAQPKFFANKWLKGLGTYGLDRMVIYRYDQEVVRMPLPMEVTRGATMFNPSAMATQAPYVCFVGEPQFVYLTAIRYVDNTPLGSNIVPTAVALPATKTLAHDATLNLTAELTFTPTVYDTERYKVVWTSSDATKATVSTSGIVTPVANGATNVKAEVKDYATGSGVSLVPEVSATSAVTVSGF
jgi:hypothetical protein